jgi:hypothetical protein
LRALKLVLDTELSAKNKVKETGLLAIPILRYIFGIIIWHEEELGNLGRRTRNLLTIHGQHHPKAEVDRLNVPRKQGERGLMHLEEAYIVEITTVMECVDNNEDPIIQIVRTHQHNTASATVQKAIGLKIELHREK